MSAAATPQRYFFVHAPPSTLAAIDRAVRRASERKRIAGELAAAGLHHQRAAAASERVVADLRKRPQARNNERFAFASIDLPWLVAARDPHGIAEAAGAIAALRSESEAEAFFVAQGERLGLQVRMLDRTLLPPSQPELEAWTLAWLERIAAAAPQRGWLFGRRAPVESDAVASLLGRLGPVWNEGRGRWLAALIGKTPDAAHDARILAGLDVDPAEARAAWGLPDPAAPIAAALRPLVQPHPALSPALRAPADTSLLPAPALEEIARLFTERWSELSSHAARHFLSEQLDDWRLLVVSALHVAHARGEPLLEAPDVLRYGYRWPPL